MNSLIYKNTFILSSLKIINPFISLIIVSAVSKELGAEILGQYSFILTVYAMVSMLGSLGLESLIIREVSNQKSISSIYLSSSVIISISTSLFLIISMNLAGRFLTSDQEVRYGIQIMSAAILPGTLVEFFHSFFMAFEKMKLIFYEQILSNISRTILSVMVILIGYGLISLIYIYLLVSILSLIISIILYNKYISNLLFKIDIKIVIDLLKKSPTFLMITVVSLLSWRVDVIMLTKYSDFIQVGLYSAAYKLFEAAMILPQGYMKSSFPELSRFYRSDYLLFQKMIKDQIKYLSYYFFIALVLTLTLAQIPICFLFGRDFSGAFNILKILMLGIISWGGGRLFAYVLVSAGLQKYDLISGLIATIFNIVFNYLMIPKYGSIGAAFATFLSLTIFMSIQLFYIKKKVDLNILSSLADAFKRPIVYAIALCIIIFVLKINWIIGAFISGLILLYLILNRKRYYNNLNFYYYLKRIRIIFFK